MTDKSGQLNEAIKVLEELKRLSTVPIVIKSCINTKLLNEAIDTVLSHINTPNKTGLDDNLLDKSIEQPDNQASLSYKKVDTYTAEEMEAFAEWSYKQSYRKMWNKGKYIGYSGMREMWEQERRKKED